MTQSNHLTCLDLFLVSWQNTMKFEQIIGEELWPDWRRQQSYLAKIVLTMKNLYSMQNSTFEQKLQNGEWISPFRIFLKNKKMSRLKHEFNLNVAFWLTFPGLRRKSKSKFLQIKSKISSFNLMLHSLHSNMLPWNKESRRCEVGGAALPAPPISTKSEMCT